MKVFTQFKHDKDITECIRAGIEYYNQNKGSGPEINKTQFMNFLVRDYYNQVVKG